jgi:hypothetical protein
MPWFGFGKKKKCKDTPLDILTFEDGSIILVPTGYRPTRTELERTVRKGCPGLPYEGPQAGFFNYTASPWDADVLDAYNSRLGQPQKNPSQQQRSPSQNQHGGHHNSFSMGGTQRTLGGYATDQPQFFMQGMGGGPGMPSMDPNAFSGGPCGSEGHSGGENGGSRGPGGHSGGGNGSRCQGNTCAGQPDSSQNQSTYSQRPHGQGN